MKPRWKQMKCEFNLYPLLIWREWHDVHIIKIMSALRIKNTSESDPRYCLLLESSFSCKWNLKLWSYVIKWKLLTRIFQWQCFVIAEESSLRLLNIQTLMNTLVAMLGWSYCIPFSISKHWLILFTSLPGSLRSCIRRVEQSPISTREVKWQP